LGITRSSAACVISTGLLARFAVDDVMSSSMTHAEPPGTKLTFMRMAPYECCSTSDRLRLRSSKMVRSMAVASAAPWYLSRSASVLRTPTVHRCSIFSSSRPPSTSPSPPPSCWWWRVAAAADGAMLPPVANACLACTVAIPASHARDRASRAAATSSNQTSPTRQRADAASHRMDVGSR